ncbi:GNAT family N-acetyltransferase [Campylobacter concisus]|uniref:GNAT family N-acetyltransferase n=2 Tax=Campylobacter concisus TaxID=199 RepID=UPI00122D3515|nr:GNAT family N-acetyltransferase [Campylobacter concisus]
MDKSKYKKLCSMENNIPIFCKDWWLDIVCGSDNWNVVLVEKGNQIWGSMPFFVIKKHGFELISMPMLTQTMGIFIKYPPRQKYYKKLSWEKEIITELMCKVGRFDGFYQNFHYSITNSLPFYWLGFDQSVKYTYQIKNVTAEFFENNLETDVRRRRRKAIENGVHIIESDNVEVFYKLNKMTFERQEKEISYDLEFVKKIYIECKKHDSARILVAEYNKIAIAAAFLVSDESSVYYLMGGIDPTYKELGAMDMILFESIKSTLRCNKIFDFEGSMIESIEKYFRSFGAVQVPYFSISKTNSKLLKITRCIKGLF